MQLPLRQQQAGADQFDTATISATMASDCFVHRDDGVGNVVISVRVPPEWLVLPDLDGLHFDFPGQCDGDAAMQIIARRLRTAAQSVNIAGSQTAVHIHRLSVCSTPYVHANPAVSRQAGLTLVE